MIVIKTDLENARTHIWKWTNTVLLFSLSKLSSHLILIR